MKNKRKRKREKKGVFIFIQNILFFFFEPFELGASGESKSENKINKASSISF